MFKGIDLFSDTLTKPSAAMKTAMMTAEVGDEQKGEDPTTKQLEETIASMLGFDKALFVPCANMANQIALCALGEPGDELIAAENCHLFFAETGGPAANAKLQAKPINVPTGIFSAEDLKQHYRWNKGPRYPISKIVSVENTTNMGGGLAWSKTQLDEIKNCAKELNLKMHLDGARFFNAVIKMGMDPKEIAGGFDTVTICLSKGLGCPMGALIVFKKEYYDKILRLKFLMGGALRQSGIIAAAGIYALKNNINRLQEDHDNASLLAKLLSEIPAIKITNNPPPTNMVFFEIDTKYISPEKFNETCINNGVRFSQVGKNRFRAVTHLDISTEDIKVAVKKIKEIV